MCPKLLCKELFVVCTRLVSGRSAETLTARPVTTRSEPRAANRPISWYYTFRVPATPDPAPDVHGPSLLVGRINGPGILKNEPIAYRVGTHEIGTYANHRWEEPPVDMLKISLIRQLRDSGAYSSVNSLMSDSTGQFVVRGSLYDFEEVDDANIAALVSMEFDLLDRKTGEVLWSHFYSQSEPVEAKKIPDVVAALNRNLDRGLKQVTASLGDYFAKPLAQK
jgi:ABC-type uncharacterized transport system auxiliary subunit